MADFYSRGDQINICFSVARQVAQIDPILELACELRDLYFRSYLKIKPDENMEYMVTVLTDTFTR